jgi:hypothetical protein
MSSSNIFSVLQDEWSQCTIKRKHKRKQKLQQPIIVERKESIHDNFITSTDFPSLTNNMTISDISKKWKDIPINVKNPKLPSITLHITKNSPLQNSIDQAFANKSSIRRKK